MADNTQTIQIKDLVILGRSCPEPLKDGRVTVCLAGWSETLGFVRLYPTRRDMPGKRWDIISVEVEKNPRDTRTESWKIHGSKSDWENLSDNIEVVGRYTTPEARRNLVVNLLDKSVNFVNGEKRSLGIVKPSVLKTYFRENNRYGELFQQALPGFTDLDGTLTKRDYPQQPVVCYTCPDDEESTTEHKHQVLEWGFYEWIRKNPTNPEQVWENSGFYNDKYDVFFLVGNQLAHRNNFMVISVLRLQKGAATKDMFRTYRKLPPEEYLR